MIRAPTAHGPSAGWSAAFAHIFGKATDCLCAHSTPAHSPSVYVNSEKPPARQVSLQLPFPDTTGNGHVHNPLYSSRFNTISLEKLPCSSTVNTSWKAGTSQEYFTMEQPAVQTWLRAMCHCCRQLSPIMLGTLPCEQAAAVRSSSHIWVLTQTPLPHTHQVQTKGAYSRWLISEKEERVTLAKYICNSL